MPNKGRKCKNLPCGGKNQKKVIFAPSTILPGGFSKASAFTGRVNGNKFRRDGRVVDCGGLENRCPGDWTGGSNPSLSATPLENQLLTEAGDQIGD